MIYTLTADGMSYWLAGQRELAGAPIKFQDRARAVDFLRRFLNVSSAMRSLRAALASERSMIGNPAGKMPDARVIEAVATLLIRGRFGIAPAGTVATKSGKSRGPISGMLYSLGLPTFPIAEISEKGQAEIRKFEG